MSKTSTIIVQREDAERGPEGVIFVRGYRALRATLNDWRSFSSDTLGMNVLTPQDKTRSFKQYPFELDPPEHGDLRAVVEPFFKRPLDPTYAARLQSHVAEAVTRLLAAPQIEVAEGFSFPLQSRALTVLLDMPVSEADIWLQWGIDVFGSPATGAAPDLQKADVLLDYVASRTDAAESLPPGSLFAVLARARVRGERPLTRDERMGFAHIAFAGGRDTVIGTLTGIVALFAKRPDVMQALAADHSLAPSAVEELIRLISPLRVLTRTCPHGGTVDGVPVAPGQRLAMCYGSASHDPSVFADPDTFRIDRKPNPHLAFGAGPHTCLGNAHARLLARQVMLELATRAKGIEILDAVPEDETAPHSVQGLRFHKLVVRAS
jgi:cytochrome P450